MAPPLVLGMRLPTPKNRKHEEVLYLQKSTMHISKLNCRYVSYFMFDLSAALKTTDQDIWKHGCLVTKTSSGLV